MEQLDWEVIIRLAVHCRRRYRRAGRSQNSLVTGLARHGAEISAATLTSTCAQAGALLVPLAEAIAARSRDSWHLHADETSWRVLAPRAGDGPAKWWLWGLHRPGHHVLRHGPVEVRGRC